MRVKLVLLAVPFFAPADLIAGERASEALLGLIENQVYSCRIGELSDHLSLIGEIVFAQNSCDDLGWRVCNEKCKIQWDACTVRAEGNDQLAQQCRQQDQACIQQCRDSTGC